MTNDYFANVSVERQGSPHKSVSFLTRHDQSPESGKRSPWLFGENSNLPHDPNRREDHGQASPVVGSQSPQLASTFSEFSISKCPSRSCAASLPKQPRKSTSNETWDSSDPVATTAKKDAVRPLLPVELADLVKEHDSETLLLLDMRTACNFSVSRVFNAINISVPATLLKRTSVTIPKIIDSLSSAADQRQVRCWTKKKFIVIYDSDTFHVGPGTVLHQFISKFICVRSDSLQEAIHIVKGGFAAISRDCPALINSDPVSPAHDKLPNGDSTNPCSKSKLSLKGMGRLTCILPTQHNVANPFFNNIRQNSDLIGGVGDPIPLQIPPDAASYKDRLPIWLREVAFSTGGAKAIADKFLKIEEEEQARMQRVLNAGIKMEKDDERTIERHSIAAGVERGDKNRYNNIWPYENARVRLQQTSPNACDYVNASYLHAKDSNKYYIATQGPLPGTTRDFWQIIWENDVQIVVMLTKTVEEGQQKCHAYWDDSVRMHPFKLDLLEENSKDVVPGGYSQSSFRMRKFALSNDSVSAATSKDIVHVQFSDWPDLHVIGPELILELVEQVRQAATSVDQPAVKRRKSVSSMTHSGTSDRPLVCHCSAGCGRTGVFCTVDTVTSMLRRQIRAGHDPDQQTTDLVEQVVRDFRDQRLSMVQT